MDEKEKQRLIAKLKRGENGDTARDDDDLYKSESLMKKAYKFKSNYKDYYDDVKLHIKEDW